MLDNHDDRFEKQVRDSDFTNGIPTPVRAMRLFELKALCKGDPTYRGWTAYTNRRDLLDFVMDCDKRVKKRSEYQRKNNYDRLLDESFR